MDELHRSLLELQELDEQIAFAEDKLAAFTPRLATVEAPATELQREVDVLRQQAESIDQDARRLERAAEEKRERLLKYESHLEKARNQREESAARTEIDLVRKAIEADDAEASEKLDQLKRTRLRLDDFETRLEKAREEIEPRRQEIVAEQSAAAGELAVLRSRRDNQAVRVPAAQRTLYERIRGTRRRAALVAMTPTGACASCYNTLPIQEQNEVRRGGTMHRCEACGVILYAPD